MAPVARTSPPLTGRPRADRYPAGITAAARSGGPNMNALRARELAYSRTALVRLTSAEGCAASPQAVTWMADPGSGSSPIT
jgi:hypothetical protein